MYVQRDQGLVPGSSGTVVLVSGTGSGSGSGSGSAVVVVVWYDRHSVREIIFTDTNR